MVFSYSCLSCLDFVDFIKVKSAFSTARYYSSSVMVCAESVPALNTTSPKTIFLTRFKRLATFKLSLRLVSFITVVGSYAGGTTPNCLAA